MIVIWDESTMSDRYHLETLNKTAQDITLCQTLMNDLTACWSFSLDIAYYTKRHKSIHYSGMFKL